MPVVNLISEELCISIIPPFALALIFRIIVAVIVRIVLVVFDRFELFVVALADLLGTLDCGERRGGDLRSLHRRNLNLFEWDDQWLRCATAVTAIVSLNNARLPLLEVSCSGAAGIRIEHRRTLLARDRERWIRSGGRWAHGVGDAADDGDCDGQADRETYERPGCKKFGHVLSVHPVRGASMRI